jgi:hypothetical protein
MKRILHSVVLIPLILIAIPCCLAGFLWETICRGFIGGRNHASNVLEYYCD